MNKQKKKTGPKIKAKSERIRVYSIGLKGNQVDFVEMESKYRGLNVSEYIRALIEADRALKIELEALEAAG